MPSSPTHRPIRKGIAFSDMLFFDDDPNNIRDVSALGVCSILTPQGVTEEAWQEGLATFAATKS